MSPRPERKAYFEDYNAKRPPRVRSYEDRREAQLKRIGWTSALVKACSELQGGVCAICSSTRKLVSDHDHKTGTARGLLCHRCNIELGFYEKTWRARGAVWEPFDTYLSHPPAMLVG